MSYRKLSGLVFALVAIVHGIRAIAGWPVLVNDVQLPIWVSWAAVVGAGLLSIWALGGRK